MGVQSVMSVFVCLYITLPSGSSLKMKIFEVPPHVILGEDAVLRCEFDLDGENLYSIKWYKGGREFFRYVPNESPTKQRYHVDGVNVDEEASTGKKVVLRNTTLATSGRYKCEVLGEAPVFDTLAEFAVLTVVKLPREEPQVSGAQERYRPGDWVNVNCSSALSKPAASLTWFINGKPAPKEYLVRYPDVINWSGLENATLGLNFQASHDHFPKGVMSLRCIASIGVRLQPFQDKGNSFIPALSLESREHTYGSSTSSRSPGREIAILLLILAFR